LGNSFGFFLFCTSRLLKISFFNDFRRFSFERGLSSGPLINTKPKAHLLKILPRYYLSRSF
jgi:hypothetical protein